VPTGVRAQPHSRVFSKALHLLLIAHLLEAWIGRVKACYLSSLHPTWIIESGFRTDQIRRLPRFAEHLKQHLGRLLEQLDPVAEIGGMALDLAADLQPITQQHRPQLGNQLLTGIARLPEGAAQNPLEQ
jgi:hypothetical protein